MIDIELPCCGGEAHLAELADEIRCEGCGVVVALATDPAPAPLDLAPVTLAASPLAA